MPRGRIKTDEECRLEAVRVRLTAAERMTLNDLAIKAGLSISEFTRQRLGLNALVANDEPTEVRIAMTR